MSSQKKAKAPDNAGERQVHDDRGPNGRFLPGRSGNPAGMRPGTRHRATRLAESLLDGQSELLVNKVMELAMQGDVAALKLCLERVLPPRKERPVSLSLPEVSTAAGIAESMAAITRAVADGELTLGEAQSLAAILEIQRKAIETAELERRVAGLEARTLKPEGDTARRDVNEPPKAN